MDSTSFYFPPDFAICSTGNKNLFTKIPAEICKHRDITEIKVRWVKKCSLKFAGYFYVLRSVNIIQMKHFNKKSYVLVVLVFILTKVIFQDVGKQQHCRKYSVKVKWKHEQLHSHTNEMPLYLPLNLKRKQRRTVKI